MAAYVYCLKEKDWKNEIIVFVVPNMTFLFVTSQGCQGNQNKLRTLQLQKWKKIEQPASNKIYWSLLKKECTAPPSLLVVTARYRSRSLLLVSTLTMNECKYHQPGGFSKYSRACIYEKYVQRVMKSGGCLCEIGNPTFCLFLYLTAYIFEASYSRMVTPSAKNQVSTNQNSDWST